MDRNITPLLIVTMTVLSAMKSASASLHCPRCGKTPVPYPLSTEPTCGDPAYKVLCEAGKLWFQALNHSPYLITSIDPSRQRLILRPPGYARPGFCVSADFQRQGMWLDNSLPFNITTSNTIIKMNCSSEVLQLFLNCTSSSFCHDYIRGDKDAAAACGTSPICCGYTTGGPVSSFHIRAVKERCSMYQSFINLDPALPVSKWPKPGIEIQWALPHEPICKVKADCEDLSSSLCLRDNKSGQRRCLCKAAFQWDPINGACQDVKCLHGKRCKLQRIRAPLIGSLTLAAGAVLVGTMGIIMVRRQRQRVQQEAQININKGMEEIINASSSGGKMAKIFTSKEIAKATNNFSKDRLLGTGGFGEVFKAVLEDGTIAAVKRAKLGNTKGINQLLNEVRILCQVHHRHLVKLLGCCVELDQPLLIYEYIPGGNLFEHLHRGRYGKSPPLTWRSRLHVAHQTAEAIAYLHSSAMPPIYHRDIKSSNILLDEKLNARVSDFGLSRLGVTDVTHITTCAQGTLGYLDPEYYINFQLTDKSDVYSFGVVLLELLTSMKAIDFNREEEDVNLVVHVKKISKEERLMEVLDPPLLEGASKLEIESIKALGYLATTCLDEHRKNRPSMKEVADAIEYILSVVTGEEDS